jgi:DNA-binding MarR family transcriptional regulator
VLGRKERSLGEKPELSIDLSHVLLAFTIEADNEVEQGLRDTGARPVSLVMWSNVMRYVTDQGITVRDVAHATCQPHKPVASIVGGLERWRYLIVEHDPREGAVPRRDGFGSARGVKPRTVLRPTTAGAVARQLWEPVVAKVEERWVERFGSQDVDELRNALARIDDQLGVAMPRYLPVLSAKGLFAAPVVALRERDGQSTRDLPTLLSRVLLAFTMDYERGSAVSLPIAANVLRVLSPDPTPITSVPLATGLSKEAVSTTLTWLDREDYVAVKPDPNGRGKVVALTAAGSATQHFHLERLTEIETAWNEQFGPDTVATLKASLARILGNSSLPAGLVTPAGGWRGESHYKARTAAFIDQPATALPQSPVVLHRGGWPDGS